MRTHSRFFFFFIVALGLTVTAAYAAAKITFTPSEPRVSAAAKDPSCKIEVLESRPDRKYVKIGIINYHNEWHRTSSGDTPAKAMPQIQKRACQAGADAIMGIQVTERKILEFAMLNVRVATIRFETEGP